MFGFAKALAVAHGHKALQSVTDAIVDLDPATASKAQLDMMEDSLNKVNEELTKLKITAAHERSDANAVKSRFDMNTAAATALNTRYEAETDPVKKASLEKSLNGLMSTLEDIKRELDQNEQAAAESEALVTETTTIYEQKAADLLAAKRNLAKAAQELDAAKVAREHANEQAEHAAEIAGLRDNKTDGLNAALTSMQRQAEQARGDAEAAKLKASVLTKAEHGSMDDPNVLEALASVQASPSNISFADRLAALKSK